MKSKNIYSNASFLRLAVIITCYNRCSITLRCLEALLQNQRPFPKVRLDVYLVDDGSTDGTSEFVRKYFPEVAVLQGGGLFWNGGMRLAFAEALKHDYDYYLWLNDDTILFPDALETLLKARASLSAKGIDRAIIVSSTKDPQTGEHTYGGLVRASWWHPIKYRMVEPTSQLQRCETMHGNCVLIPRSVAERVGNLEATYKHAWGDIDYSLRAWEHGCSVWIAPGYMGTCSRNAKTNTWLDTRLPLRERLAKAKSPKGIPPKDYRLFTQRHAGLLWPIYWVMPYIRLVATSIRETGRSAWNYVFKTTN